MQKYVEKADILVEAIPYIQSFKNKVVVIKYGGTVLLNKEIQKLFLKDVVFLNTVGIKPVLVHGGGLGINEEIKKTGRVPEFIDGLRVTGEKDIIIVKNILENLNSGLVEEIRSLGAEAEGFTSEKKLIKIHPVSPELGYVGEISEIQTDILKSSLDSGCIPVIAPLGIGENGKIYNVNADRVSSEISVVLKASKLVLLTHVDGIFKNPEDSKTLISSLDITQMQKLIEEGVVKGGMIPKIKAGCLSVKKGVDKVHIINGNISHALLLEIFTDKGIGTQIIKQEK